jgi:NAD(P)H dehydrogenase (quinone)
MNRREFLQEAGNVVLAAVFLLGSSTTQAADAPPVTVLVVYHSASGNTEKMAQGVAEGAKAVSGTKVILKPVSEAAADDLLSSDAVIVGSPVYFGNMSGEVKTFFDNWNLKFRLSQERRMVSIVGQFS